MMSAETLIDVFIHMSNWQKQKQNIRKHLNMHKETQKSQKIAILVLNGAVIDLQF